MRISLIFAIIFVSLFVLNNSQKQPTIPWPPQTSYRGLQTNWTQIAPTNYLKPREYQSVVYDMNNNRLIIFGGRTANGTYLNDVWSWSFVARRFIQIFPRGAPISERSDHLAAVDVAGQKMYVFGGKNNKGTLGDFWYLSLVSGSEKWVNVCTKKNSTVPCDNLPPTRWGAMGGSFVGANYGNYFFVSHGKSGFSTVRSDTWIYDFKLNLWKDISGKDANQGRFVAGYSQATPSPRFSASHTMVGPTSMAIYGGCGAGGYGACPSSDGWLMTYQPTTNSSSGITWIKFPGCPVRSYNGQAAPIPGTNQTTIDRFSQPFFFGGYGGNTGGGYQSNNIFEIYDTISTLSGFAKWSRTTLLSLRNSPLQTPQERTGASMLLVHPIVEGPDYDFVVFFGGRDRHSTVRSDLWYLTGQSVLGRRYQCTKNTNWRMVHGILMFISFGAIYPLTMMLARFGKDDFLSRLRDKSPWLWTHAIANIFGSIVVIPALVVGIVAVNTAHFTSVPHAYLGIIAFAFVIFNPIWGALRPKKDSDVRAPWAYVHLWIGRLAIVLGLINILLGILMIRASIVILALYIVYVALYIIIFIVLFFLNMKKSGDSCGQACNPIYQDKYNYN